MTKRDPLTVEDIEAEARARGLPEFAEWIVAEVARRDAAWDAAQAAPLDTPAGVIEFGIHYDVTITRRRKERRLRRVTLSRSDYFPALVYDSGKVAVYLYGPGDANTIVKVESTP